MILTRLQAALAAERAQRRKNCEPVPDTQNAEQMKECEAYLINLVAEKHISREELMRYLGTGYLEEKLDALLSRLDLNYNMSVVQDYPYPAIVSVVVLTPVLLYNVLQTAASVRLAKRMAIRRIFRYFYSFML